MNNREVGPIPKQPTQKHAFDSGTSLYSYGYFAHSQRKDNYFVFSPGDGAWTKIFAYDTIYGMPLDHVRQQICIPQGCWALARLSNKQFWELYIFESESDLDYYVQYLNLKTR